jgi:hypothetical protein
MMPVKEIRKWLDRLKPSDMVGVDDGGLALRVESDPEEYIELGGMPEDWEGNR